VFASQAEDGEAAARVAKRQHLIRFIESLAEAATDDDEEDDGNVDTEDVDNDKGILPGGRSSGLGVSGGVGGADKSAGRCRESNEKQGEGRAGIDEDDVCPVCAEPLVRADRRIRDPCRRDRWRKRSAEGTREGTRSGTGVGTESERIPEAAAGSIARAPLDASRDGSRRASRGPSGVVSVVVLPVCGHGFHGPCLVRWLAEDKATCPTCRACIEAPSDTALAEDEAAAAAAAVGEAIGDKAGDEEETAARAEAVAER